MVLTAKEIWSLKISYYQNDFVSKLVFNDQFSDQFSNQL